MKNKSEFDLKRKELEEDLIYTFIQQNVKLGGIETRTQIKLIDNTGLLGT